LTLQNIKKEVSHLFLFVQKVHINLFMLLDFFILLII